MHAHKIHSASDSIVPSQSIKLKHRGLVFSDAMNVTGIDLGKHTYFPHVHILFATIFLFAFASIDVVFISHCLYAKCKSSLIFFV